MTAKITTAKNMAKIKIGWNKYVVSMKDAAAIMAALENAERFVEDYIPSSERGPDDPSHRYYIGGDLELQFDVELLPEEIYLIGKYAGPKPA